MAVRLRLRRVGKKKMPMYHIVAADSRKARTGKFLEIVGRYEPMRKPAEVTTKEDRLFYWLRNGATPTDTVRSLLRNKGLWMKWALTKKGADEATISQEMEKWEMMREAKRKREEENKEARKSRKKTAGKTEEGEPAGVAAGTAEVKSAETAPEDREDMKEARPAEGSAPA